jgi:hypothetical protein
MTVRDGERSVRARLRVSRRISRRSPSGTEAPPPPTQ